MSSINQNENKEIFSCQFRGLEFSIKDAAGDDFSLNLQRERRKQSSSAISLRLSRNCGLRTNFVILCPARRSSRDSFDEIYNHFLSKAKELQIQSMTLPLLGTDDDDDMDSFWNENISSNHSAVSMNDSHSSVSDVSVSLDTDLDSDLEDSDEENDLSDLDGFSSESSANEDEAPKSQKVRFNDESVYWSVVPHQQLLSSQKPTTSNNANLDDSTLPCSICLCDMRDILENAGNCVVQLSLCSHMFHMECIRAAFKVKEQCPLCMCWYKDPIGYQPKDAKMTVRQIQGQVQGHKDAKGFHEITYYIPSGIQIDGHIRPGRPYRSMTRIAYLPNNKEGTQILKLLQLAFKRRLIFTIGDSLTTGRKDVPIWNGIHHKTNKEGGPQCYGYPDPGYLSRVKEELAAVGVRSEQLKD
uniref:E3 ubiquitin-protein ligase n=2 Tax=Meloidogyne incognita group TaxID=654580 RepID=A0A915LLJ0_MELJA